MKLKLKKKEENNTIVHNNILSSRSCLFFFVYSKTTDNRKKQETPSCSTNIPSYHTNFHELRRESSFSNTRNIPEATEKKRNKTKKKERKFYPVGVLRRAVFPDHPMQPPLLSRPI